MHRFKIPVPAILAAIVTAGFTSPGLAIPMPMPLDQIQIAEAGGASIVDAIVIVKRDIGHPASAEREYLTAHFGTIGVDWTLVSQSLSEVNGRWFDCIQVQTKSSQIDVYFDVTAFIQKK